MRLCPQCGWPKEIHDRIPDSTSKRLPKSPAPMIRLCVLETVDLVGPDEDIPLKRADVEVYARRLVAYEEERRVGGS